MKAKKLTAAVMAAVILGSLTACGDDTEEMPELPAETFSSAEETRTGTMIGSVIQTTAEETTVAETTTKETEKLTETSVVTSAEITTTTAATTVVTTVTETETAAETAPTAKTDPATGLYLTSDGLVLDPDNLPDETATWDSYEENVPYFIAQPADNIRIYGVLRDESHLWTYTFWDYEYTCNEYIIIEHDGIVDEFGTSWLERFGNPIEAENVCMGDYDSDGEDEISVQRYWIGGTQCMVFEFSIYDLEDGHYVRYTVDNEALLSEYISWTLDDNTHIMTFKIKDSDITFTVDVDEKCPDGVFDNVSFGSLVSFEVSGNNLKIYTSAFLDLYYGCTVNMQLNYSDGKFTCSDPEWEEIEY